MSTPDTKSAAQIASAPLFVWRCTPTQSRGHASERHREIAVKIPAEGDECDDIVHGNGSLVDSSWLKKERFAFSREDVKVFSIMINAGFKTIAPSPVCVKGGGLSIPAHSCNWR